MSFIGTFMARQITKRTKCKRKKIREGFVALLKQGLLTLLMRPSTWNFLMVKLPEWAEKCDSLLMNILSFLSDLFP